MVRCRNYDVMPYGKFAGEPLENCGRGYLAMVLCSHDIDDEFKAAIRRTLAEMGLAFGRYKDVPLSEVESQYLRWVLSLESSHEFPLMRELLGMTCGLQQQLGAGCCKTLRRKRTSLTSLAILNTLRTARVIADALIHRTLRG